MSKNGASDGIDACVASVLNAGFATGGDAAQIEVLTRIAQVFLTPSPRILGHHKMHLSACCSANIACQTSARLQSQLHQHLHATNPVTALAPASRHSVWHLLVGQES